MPKENRRKIIRLLGVGFDGDDGHVRITSGEKFDVLMGSEESHDYINQLIIRVEEELKKRDISLDDLTPEEFSEFIRSLQ